jgi:hypothetical protein
MAESQAQLESTQSTPLLQAPVITKKAAKMYKQKEAARTRDIIETYYAMMK